MSGIHTLRFLPYGPHVLLGSNRETTRRALEVLRTELGDRFVYIEAMGAHDHRSVIAAEMLRRYDGSEPPSILTTMNPLVVDNMYFKSVGETQARLLRVSELCGIRHLTLDEASRFWRSYDAGIQHVSELLYDNGLWE